MISRKTYHLLAIALAIHSTLAANEPLFRFDGNPISFRPTPGDGSTDSASTSSTSDDSNASSLVWQPLRASFRPLNRQSQPQPPSPPPPPLPPREPLPPSSPFESTANDFSPSDSSSNFDTFSSTNPTNFEASSFSRLPFPSARSTAAAAVSTTTTTATTTQGPSTTSAPSSNFAADEDDQPTRVPSSRFRPTKAPSVDPQAQPSTNVFSSTPASGSGAGGSGSTGGANGNRNSTYQMTQDCFECICEASTNCNTNSRCQTSDVRHTRCGMFLISYEQWLETNLSRELVTREALEKDAAADERAFYECVTQRECAERLLSIYMAKNGRDCDKDGRIDCYDLAAIHQGGVQQCASESLLESQYWSDFNACFGFGR